MVASEQNHELRVNSVQVYGSPATASTTNEAVEPGYGGSGVSETFDIFPLLLTSGHAFQVKALLYCNKLASARRAAKVYAAILGSLFVS